MPTTWFCSRMEVFAVLGSQGPAAEPRIGRPRHGGPVTRGADRSLASPRAPLRERDHHALAGRADPLVVLHAVGELVAESEFALDLDQILDVHARREFMSA